jgi:hypothetical protein
MLSGVCVYDKLKKKTEAEHKYAATLNQRVSNKVLCICNHAIASFSGSGIELYVHVGEDCFV